MKIFRVNFTKKSKLKRGLIDETKTAGKSIFKKKKL